MKKNEIDRLRLNAAERSLIRALNAHDAIGIHALTCRAAGRSLALQSDLQLMLDLTLAIRALIKRGLVETRPWAKTVHLSLSPLGKHIANRLSPVRWPYYWTWVGIAPVMHTSVS